MLIPDDVLPSNRFFERNSANVAPETIDRVVDSGLRGTDLAQGLHAQYGQPSRCGRPIQRFSVVVGRIRVQTVTLSETARIGEKNA